MVLADHFGELGRPHSVRQRTGRVLIEAGGGEQVAHDEQGLKIYPLINSRSERRRRA
jgi:hypothetical protein